MAFECPSCSKLAPVVYTSRVNVATDRRHYCAGCDLHFGTREVLGVTTLRPLRPIGPSKKPRTAWHQALADLTKTE